MNALALCIAVAWSPVEPIPLLLMRDSINSRGTIETRDELESRMTKETKPYMREHLQALDKLITFYREKGMIQEAQSCERMLKELLNALKK